MAANGPGPHDFTPYNAGTAPPVDAAAATIQAFAAGFFESAGAAITTVLNRSVTVHAADVHATPAAALVAELEFPCIVAEATYQRGLKGTLWLLFNRTGALSFADALTGDEPTEIGPTHQEAFREAVNQVLLSAGPALMPLFGRSIAFAPTSVQMADDATALPDALMSATPEVWIARVRADDSEGLSFDIVLVITPDIAQEVVAIGAEQTTPPAAAPAEAPVEVGTPSKIDMILDVTLPVTVELGRARMQIQEVLKLGPGSVIELDKSAGDPVDLYINDRPIAKGEVVVIDENFGVRLTSIVTTTERIKTLR